MRKELVSNQQKNIGTLRYITKKDEFELLVDLIKRHKLAIGKRKGFNILALSRSLNVDRKTLKSWLNTPVVKDTIREELEFYIDKMMESGKDDWRQWKAQIELALPHEDITKDIIRNNINITSSDNKFEISYGEK
jgi:hypothetical protein